MDIHLPYGLVVSLQAIIFLPLLICISCVYFLSHHKFSKLGKCQHPKTYPLFGCIFSVVKNRHRIIMWSTELLRQSPSSTVTLTGPLGQSWIITANPSNVKHILKTRFNTYQKDVILQRSLHDMLGNGIFLVDGTKWKVQRQLYIHEFKTDTFHFLVETITQKELSTRLLPLFSAAESGSSRTVLDLQEILHRFTFDMVCQIGFGYDPQYLLPSLPNAPLADAYGAAINICIARYICPPLVWKTKKLLNIGSEKNLGFAVNDLREFIRKRIMEKKKDLLNNNTALDVSGDFLYRMLARAHKNMSIIDENYCIDEAINLILGAEDTLCSALIWFFWLVSSNPQVEKEIVREISEQENNNKVYLHASICESMRLYPPIPQESKQAMEDDILPDGTKVKKGTRVIYNIFAMGRSTELWGKTWEDFSPERWLERDGSTGDWRFIPRDPFTYPVFQAGPRTCVGKDIAFMQIKLVATTVLKEFQLVPAVEGYSPVYGSSMTSKMKNGFPVRIMRRIQI